MSDRTKRTPSKTPLHTMPNLDVIANIRQDINPAQEIPLTIVYCISQKKKNQTLFLSETMKEQIFIIKYYLDSKVF